MPDYNKVKPKVNTNNTPRSGSENREVSGAVLMEASNPPGIGWKF
jgi:hypothetical protein